MALATSLVFVWPGTNASIPAGWSRETALDDRYPSVSSSDDAGTTGGSVTHTHTFTTTSHDFSAGAPAGFRLPAADGTKNRCATTTHTHAATASWTSSVTTGTAINDPVHVDVIFIKPADADRVGVPAGGWALHAGMETPPDWSMPSGPKDKLIRGAAADGDSDLVGSGSAAHLHTEDHGHTTKYSSSSSGQTAQVYPEGIAKNSATAPHVHPVVLDQEVVSTDGQDATPTWQKLAVIQNDTGSESLPDGLLAFYLGLIADIPAYWSRFSFSADRDLVMGASTTDEVGDVGGSLFHAHTGDLHSHSSTVGAPPGCGDPGGSVTVSAVTHSVGWTVTEESDTITACASREAYPPYTKVLLLQYESIHELAGTSAGSSTASGSLVGEGQVGGTAEGSSTASATLGGDGGVAGIAGGSSAADGVLSGIGTVGGTSAGSSQAYGELVGEAAPGGAVEVPTDRLALVPGDPRSSVATAQPREADVPLYDDVARPAEDHLAVVPDASLHSSTVACGGRSSTVLLDAGGRGAPPPRGGLLVVPSGGRLVAVPAREGEVAAPEDGLEVLP